MRFMMLVIPKGYADARPDMTPDPDMIKKMEMYNETLRDAGMLLSLNGLHPPSAGARIVFGGAKPVVTRGPFPDARNAVGGYWLIKAKSQDEAIEWASRAPMEDGDIIEVREVQEAEELAAEAAKTAAPARSTRPATRSAARPAPMRAKGR